MAAHRVTEPSPLLEWLLKNFSGLKRTKVKQILKYGSVRVNGRVVTWHRHELRPGDTVDILSRSDALAERLKTRLDFSIVHEDADVVVVEKPEGLLTMGTEKEREKTLYFELTRYVRAKSPDGRGRVFIVHRLDRESSGLVVFAKNEKAKRALQQSWGRAIKKYSAVVEGVPAKKSGTLRSWLREDASRRVWSAAKRSGGSKEAVTHYAVLRENGRYALIDITLETGRKNQIRVHLSELGHPIAGDAKYGARSNPIERLALHASKLAFPHPATGALKTFHSKPPESFENLAK